MTEAERVQAIAERLDAADWWQPDYLLEDTLEGEPMALRIEGLGGVLLPDDAATHPVYRTRWALVANAPADLAFLLAALADAHRLIEVMRQDGTPAQDLATRTERARVVDWLRERKESARKTAARAAADGNKAMANWYSCGADALLCAADDLESGR